MVMYPSYGLVLTVTISLCDWLHFAPDSSDPIRVGEGVVIPTLPAISRPEAAMAHDVMDAAKRRFGSPVA